MARTRKADLEHEIRQLREGSYWEGLALGALARDEAPAFERTLLEPVSGARIRVRAWGLHRADNGVVLVQQYEDSDDARGSWTTRGAYKWAADTAELRVLIDRAEGLAALASDLRNVAAQLRHACIEAVSGPTHERVNANTTTGTSAG